MAMIPFLLAAILFSFFGLQRRKWQQGQVGARYRSQGDRDNFSLERFGTPAAPDSGGLSAAGGFVFCPAVSRSLDGVTSVKPSTS